jgi:proliferating cell nuclear antigen PCNA
MSVNIIITDPIKSDIFASIFQHIKLFTDTINIMFEKERMYIQSMDAARVSIFEIIIPATWFDTYAHNINSGVTIGLSSTMLFKVLSTRDKIQETRIMYEDDESDKLYINFTSVDNKSIFDRQFEMPLIELEYEIMVIPASESQAEFSIASSNFANIINQLKIFGDALDIDCNEERILLTSVSQEFGKMLVTINIDDLTAYSINEGESMNLSFSLNHLHNICMYNKIAKEVEIHLIENFPMKIIYALGSDAKMVFYLAPKIND